MKKSAVLLLTALCSILLSSGVAQVQKQTWHLSKDIRGTGNQISFTQGAKGVWYFLESSANDHDPLTYRLLGHYGAPCDVNGVSGVFEVRGLACWSSEDAVGENRVPSTAFNFTDKTLDLGGTLAIPPKTAFLCSKTTKLAIVGWRSPAKGTIRATGSWTDLHRGGSNGVRWSIDQGSKQLLTAELPDGASQSFDLSGVTVLKGQVLYFVIDAMGAQDSDETGLDLTITQTQ